MKILVTGAAGFIGSHLCERLARMGHEVTGLDNFSDYYSVELKQQNAMEVAAAGVEMVTMDLVNDVLQDVIRGASVVYHLAAQPGIAAHIPLETYIRNNIIATHRLVQACLESNPVPYFINISTSSVYGYYATVPETSPPAPVSFYGVTKLAAEQLVMAECRKGRLPACSLRLYSVYGPRERPDKLYSKLIDCILNDRELPFFEGSQNHKRSYSFIADIIDGLTAVLDHMADCNGEYINVGCDTEITTGEGIEIVETLVGKKVRKRMLPPRQGDQIHTRADITKAKELLGYSPKNLPGVGLKIQLDWYRNCFSTNREKG